jgi:hypothetical protein
MATPLKIQTSKNHGESSPIPLSDDEWAGGDANEESDEIGLWGTWCTTGTSCWILAIVTT